MIQPFVFKRWKIIRGQDTGISWNRSAWASDGDIERKRDIDDRKARLFLQHSLGKNDPGVDLNHDPHLLLNATNSGIDAEVVNGQLRITAADETGTFQVEVFVSDGYASSSTEFVVEVTNNAPQLNIADQTAISGTPISIALPGEDADGHTVSYSVEVIGDELSALDAEHGFWSSGNYYENHLGQNERWILDGNNRWHYILPDGDLHRWERSSATDPLIAELGVEVYDDPSLLTDPDPVPVIATVEDGVLMLTAREGYVDEVEVHVRATDGYSVVSTSFRLIVVANAEDNAIESLDGVYLDWDVLEV